MTTDHDTATPPAPPAPPAPAAVIDMLEAAGAVPAPLAGALAALRQAAEAAETNAAADDAKVSDLAARLAALEHRLAVVATTLEVIDAHLARLVNLPDAWNELAGTLDAITDALGSPLARAGLRLVPVTRI
jgi:hypothetical protein